MARPFLRTSHVATTAVLVTTAGLCASVGTPAHATPPPNDTIRAAETVRIPATVSADTSGATSSPDDGECVLGSSVWYRLRPRVTGAVRITTIGSDYDTVLALFEGRPGTRRLLRCSDDAAGFSSAVRSRLKQDKTYWIALSSCCRKRAAGGDAVLRVFRRAGTPSVSVDVDAVESGGTSGRLFVSGTVVCGTVSVVEYFVTASQRVGAGVARGEAFGFSEPCSEEATPWRFRVDSTTGWAFQPGPVALELFARADDGFARASYEEELTVDAVDNPQGVARPRGGPR